LDASKHFPAAFQIRFAGRRSYSDTAVDDYFAFKYLHMDRSCARLRRAATLR
jgi:hypothetical protein